MKRVITVVLVGVLAMAATPAFSQVIKLGTVAPEGSPWHDAMLEVAQEWMAVSGGKVTLMIYPGGVTGDEKDMLRKIRIGQLHAAALTSGTLIDIVPDIEVMSFPMSIRTDGELDHVIEKLGPQFEARLAEKGFKVLTWSTAGWCRFFTKEPVISPADMRKQKLFFWGSDTTYVELLMAAGFNPVPLTINDLLPSLQTGLVDSFGAPPTAALSFQWFALAPHMADLLWQPLPGATVVSLRAWNTVPENLRPLLENAARQVGSRFQKKVRELEDQAIAAMRNHGLTVHTVPPAVEEEWRALVREKGYPVFVGPRFSKEIFQTMNLVLDAYRRSAELENRTGQ